MGNSHIMDDWKMIDMPNTPTPIRHLNFSLASPSAFVLIYCMYIQYNEAYQQCVYVDPSDRGVMPLIC